MWALAIYRCLASNKETESLTATATETSDDAAAIFKKSFLKDSSILNKIYFPIVCLFRGHHNPLQLHPGLLHDKFREWFSWPIEQGSSVQYECIIMYMGRVIRAMCFGA